MRRRLVLSGAVLAIVILARSDLGAQSRSPALVVSTWPTAPTLELVSSPQEQRLPVYDNEGEPIPFALIEARIDNSGLKGAFWGGLAMSAVGALVAQLFLPHDCNTSQGGYYQDCSPRENAMRGALGGGFSVTFGILGAWLGWTSDVTTFQEALEQVREGRRLGGSQ